MLKQLSGKSGLSINELKVFIFLILVLSAGIIYRYYRNEDKAVPVEFDYSTKDSLFRAARDKINPYNNSGNGEKKFDYKQEVLDFNKQNFLRVKPEKTSVEKSINLNAAGMDELMRIPGLGEKTAEKILQYRRENGNFRQIEQLQEIKGIGAKKFNLIKIYVYIE
jgi:competence ComEA-like helix-hairpin-helix protein